VEFDQQLTQIVLTYRIHESLPLVAVRSRQNLTTAIFKTMGFLVSHMVNVSVAVCGCGQPRMVKMVCEE
jgi:hypothetical protein